MSPSLPIYSSLMPEKAPKEGRVRSYSPRLRKRQRNTTIGLILFVLAIVVFLTLPTSQSVPSLHLEDIKQEIPGSDQIKKAGRYLSRGDPTNVQKVATKSKNDGSSTAQSQTGSVAKGTTQQRLGYASTAKDAHKLHSFGDPIAPHDDVNKFKAALNYIISLAPDEIRTRELLRPFEGTGKEKLRDIGLRAKAFKGFFDAWEALHLVSNGDDVYIRDNIVQFLRTHSETIDMTSGSLAETLRAYGDYRFFLQSFSHLLFPWTMPYFADHMSLHNHFRKGGRGIVLSAGNDQAPFLLTSIPSFRRLGCDLPIEVMYLGENDLNEDFRMELENLPGVVTRDMSIMVKDEGWKLAGWAGKPFSILLSSFREVIFIDADSLFFKNPEVLFDDPSYVKNGALFFKDRLIMPENKRLWLQQILPKPISESVRQSRMWRGESGHQQESGVVVVDKWRHFVAMLLITRMNGPDRDGNESEGRIGVYDMVYGDKETFWLGFELVGDRSYAFHEGDAGVMGTIAGAAPESSGPESKGKKARQYTDSDPDLGSSDHPSNATALEEITPKAIPEEPRDWTVCAPQLLHLAADGTPLWFNGWILNNKFADKNSKEAMKFDVYVKEPRHQRPNKPDAWQLTGENNMCCLTNNQTYAFTKQEKATLEMIAELARETGAYGKGK